LIFHVAILKEVLDLGIPLIAMPNARIARATTGLPNNEFLA
jgi:hypothetical protein